MVNPVRPQNMDDTYTVLPIGDYYFVPVEDFDTLGHVGIMNMGGKFTVQAAAQGEDGWEGQVATVVGPKNVFEGAPGTRSTPGATSSSRVYCFKITTTLSDTYPTATELSIHRVETLNPTVAHLRLVGLHPDESAGYVYDALVHKETDGNHHRMVFGFATHGLHVADPKVYYDLTTTAPTHGHVRVGCNGDGNMLFRNGAGAPRSRIHGDTEYIVVEGGENNFMPHEDYMNVYVDASARTHFPTQFDDIDGL